MSDVKQETVIAPAYLLGAADERVRIVAWLRKLAENAHTYERAAVHSAYADRIEKGEHTK